MLMDRVGTTTSTRIWGFSRFRLDMGAVLHEKWGAVDALDAHAYTPSDTTPGITYHPKNNRKTDMKNTHTFRALGRDWQLFRRGTAARPAGNDTPWSYRLTIGGKRVLVSTRTAHLETAVRMAKVRIEEVLSGNIEALRIGRAQTGGGKVPTFAQVDATYRAAKVVREDTMKEGLWALARVVRAATGLSNIDDVRIDVLTEELGRKWLALRQGLESPDYGTIHKGNTGANAALRHAQNIFARRHRAIWKAWRLPEGLEGFVGVKALPQPSARYVPIDGKRIADLDAAAGRLLGGEWPAGIEVVPEVGAADLWVVNRAIQLMGLRASEVLNMKSHWLIETDGRLLLDIRARPGEFVPKGHEGRVRVPLVLDPIWRPLYEQQHDQATAIYLVAPTAFATWRHDLIYRAHSKWVRQYIGAERQKTNHELRKHAGSLVARNTGSWEAAARFLREDLITAQKHYLAILDSIGLEDVGARPGLRVLAAAS